MPHRKGPMGGGGADNVLIVSRALSSSRVQRPSRIRIAQNIAPECLHSRLDCSIVSGVGTSLALLMKWECPAGPPTQPRLWIGQGSRCFVIVRGRVGGGRKLSQDLQMSPVTILFFCSILQVHQKYRNDFRLRGYFAFKMIWSARQNIYSFRNASKLRSNFACEMIFQMKSWEGWSARQRMIRRPTVVHLLLVTGFIFSQRWTLSSFYLMPT